MLGRMVLPSDNKLRLQLHYGGIVATDKGNVFIDMDRVTIGGGLRVYGSIGSPLEWHVLNNKSSLVIFSLELTVRKTDLTVAELPLKKRTLYVNVSFVNENGPLTEKLDELGGVTILEFVKRLEKGPAEIETKPE